MPPVGLSSALGEGLVFGGVHRDAGMLLRSKGCSVIVDRISVP